MNSTEHATDEVGLGWPVTVGEALAQRDESGTAPGVKVGLGWGDR